MQKGFTRKDPPKTLGTNFKVSCKTGTGQDRHRVRRSSIGLYSHEAKRVYRARQSLVGQSAHCANSNIP